MLSNAKGALKNQIKSNNEEIKSLQTQNDNINQELKILDNNESSNDKRNNLLGQLKSNQEKIVGINADNKNMKEVIGSIDRGIKMIKK